MNLAKLSIHDQKQLFRLSWIDLNNDSSSSCPKRKVPNAENISSSNGHRRAQAPFYADFNFTMFSFSCPHLYTNTTNTTLTNISSVTRIIFNTTITHSNDSSKITMF